MTTQSLPFTPALTPSLDRPATRPPNLLHLWLSSVFIYLAPRRRGELWLRASFYRVLPVALLNILFACGWAFLIYLAAYLCVSNRLFRAEDYSRVITASIDYILNDWKSGIKTLNILERISYVTSFALAAGGALVLPFFVLLPFAARPGKNKPCLLHVLRTVLLGTGAVHLWGITLVTTFITVALWPSERIPGLEYLRVLSPVLLAAIALTLWTFTTLITAARLDYRAPADMPRPHDPWCEDCGYNLLFAAADGRCPECGRHIHESLGAYTRPPTPWEKNPSPFNLAAIRDQLFLLIRRPRALFFSMPTLTGQPAAQRWLLFSMLPLGLLAALIIPAFPFFHDTEWSLELFTGGLAMGLVWALLGAMMVGIETAGIATFSRMKRHPDRTDGVPLAAAAKVTCYSSILMTPWAILGGAQLLASIFWFEHRLHSYFHLSLRTEQILLALSLSAAHIGGLLWYELTVYRGIRAIQYANK